MAPPGPVERLLAALRVVHPSGDGSIVAAVVQAGAPDLGLTTEEGARLALAAGAVARAVYARGFDDPAEAAVDVTLLRVGHQVMVRIDDRGLPFNAAAEDALDMDVIEQALQAGWIDTMSHESRGRDGNRTVLVRHLDPGPDLRDRSDGSGPADDPIAPAAAPIGEAVEVTSRFAVPADAEAICRLTWRTYGYTYQHDEYYQPERLAALIEGGLQASFVAVTPEGEIVGHSAALLAHDGDVVAEGGRAMVDPRFRGHHLMAAARELRLQWMNDHGVLAMEGVAVTAHTRSQTDHPIMSLQLGFLPAISFRGIEGTEVAHREAVVGGLIPFAPIPAQDVVLPTRDAAMIAQIYELHDLDRSAIETTRTPAPGSTSQVALEVRADLGHAVLTCTRIGADLRDEVHTRVASIVRGGIDVVYADLPLDQLELSWAVDALYEEGFVFSGVLPLAQRGIDMVRYQRLGDIDVVREEIHLKHPFGQTLLDYVLGQRSEFERRT